MSPFVSPLSAITQAHDRTVWLSGKAHKDSAHIVVITVVH